MKPYQSYFYDCGKLYEFRIKLADVDVTQDKVIDAIRNAVNAYQLESITTPKRLPIQEHREFPKLGACECHVIDIAVKYPTVVSQIRQLIVERANICTTKIFVFNKNAADYEAEMDEQIMKQGLGGKVLETQELETTDGQSLVGNERVEFIKGLPTRKFEFAATESGKHSTTNDIEQGNVAPVGSRQNKIPSPIKGSK